MELNVSGLKSFSFGGAFDKPEVVVSKSEENDIRPELNSKADELIIRHGAETDTKLSLYRKLCEEGKISESDCKFESLQACAEDLIYHLGIKSFYKDNE